MYVIIFARAETESWYSVEQHANIWATLSSEW